MAEPLQCSSTLDTPEFLTGAASNAKFIADFRHTIEETRGLL